MLKYALQTEQINTDADANLKGIELQKVRAVERLLAALKEGKKAVFCTIEHVDDVLEVDISKEKAEYKTEQNKSYMSSFSMNSHEIKNSLRIFIDNWLGIAEASESIQFVFYTNTSIANEKKIGVLKDIEDKLPDEPLIQLLIEKRYDLALPFVLPILKAYYIEQHSKHTKDIKTYEKLWDSISLDKWEEFFNLIEWHFGEKNESEVRTSIESEVLNICINYGVEEKFVSSIVSQLIDMVGSRAFEDDFLKRVVHVAEVKCLFLELSQNARIVENLDPMHLKWDNIKCDDIRDINSKILNVCPEYDPDLLEDLEQGYIDGLLEQKNCPDIRAIKAYNYRVYVVCKKIVKQIIKTKSIFQQNEVNDILDRLTDEAEKLIIDKAKTYKMPFLDRDMVKKTILILFQECYLALDERSIIIG